MRTKVVLAVVLSVAVSACKKSENSVTGPPAATRVLSGQVLTVGDLAGASPAGINITSSGQVAVTDAAGRFGFMSLSSDNVQLTFTRADGIAAATTISGSASAVVVELQRGRAVARIGKDKREIEGLIMEVSATSVTVNDARSHGPVTATIDSNTVIRKGNQTLTAAELKVGDRVHVKASAGSGGVLTALEIKLQHSATTNPGDRGQLKELEGLITAISPASITVNNASTGGPVTAAITANTVIRKGHTRLTTNDLKVGDRVHVKTEGPADALVATQIMLQKPGR